MSDLFPGWCWDLRHLLVWIWTHKFQLGMLRISPAGHTQDLEKVHFGSGALNILEHTQDYSTIIGF